MPTTLTSNWTDCNKLLPYRDQLGQWTFPDCTQRRMAIVNGVRRWQYREREETYEEWLGRQW